MWVTCLRERGFKRMKLWRLCTKCCVTSSHLGKLQQVLCTNHGHMLEGAWVQKDEAMKALHKVLHYNFSLGQTTASTLHEPRGSRAWGRVGSKGWSYEGFAQSAALQVLTWANYSKYFARTTWFTCLREGGFKRMKLWRLCTKCCVTSFHLGKLQQVLCTNHGYMLEGGWVQKDEAMKALHKVLRYKFSLGQTTASTLHESRLHAWGRVGSKGWSYEGFAQSAALQVLTWANYSKYFARTTWFTCLTL